MTFLVTVLLWKRDERAATLAVAVDLNTDPRTDTANTALIVLKVRGLFDRRT